MYVAAVEIIELNQRLSAQAVGLPVHAAELLRQALEWTCGRFYD